LAPTYVWFRPPLIHTIKTILDNLSIVKCWIRNCKGSKRDKIWILLSEIIQFAIQITTMDHIKGRH
jgi:hypothetical protein